MSKKNWINLQLTTEQRQKYAIEATTIVHTLPLSHRNVAKYLIRASNLKIEACLMSIFAKSACEPISARAAQVKGCIDLEKESLLREKRPSSVIYEYI